MNHPALWPVISAAVLGVSLATATSADAAKSSDPLSAIADAVIARPDLKPLVRKCVKPEHDQGQLAFYGQKSLTKDVLDAYLDRAIVHMSGGPDDLHLWGDRSRAFLKNSGAKFIHWADLGWVRRYTADDWTGLTAAMDSVHGTDWGSDIIYECGIMEAIGRPQVDNTPIPEWLMKLLTDLGIQERRKFGPNGPGYFSYEGMFDRNAEDWPKNLIGLWYSDHDAEQSVPDITMLETRIYYAYQIAEYIDAGFEGVMFGQAMLTGNRDRDNKSLNSLCAFARKWAAARGYRHAVTLTSHVIVDKDYPVSKGIPLFTHITWPTRLSYSDEHPFGMRLGPDAKSTKTRQGGEEIIQLLKLNHDLPILLEIDNYGMSPGPNPVCDAGYDEITAYASKPPKQRSEFLAYYYFESRKWRNKDGHARVHLAPTGWRCLCRAASLYTKPDGTPSDPVSFYSPYSESGGEESTIKALFDHARGPEAFR